ncbi:hypothetical protein LCGC14_3159300 [marine sediment metagenome]|uniref:Uncharacterized protein n=1 Tax=marine sediment metagenome TaxID=412755 RepID=A0A0F8XYH9_9ZZZZ
MVNGRNEMLDNVKSELIFLESMRKSTLDTIEFQQERIIEAHAKIREAHQLMDRFEQKTEMCLKLQAALEEFGEGTETLKAG